jgi:uncharacterized membrane protein (DUF373 family)
MTSWSRRVVRIHTLFEQAIVVVLLLLLIIVVLMSTGMLAAEIVKSVISRALGAPPLGMRYVMEFFDRLSGLHVIFGGFLLILIGLELMKTVVAYLDHHELHVEVVFTVAMIAIARHAIDLNLSETPPLTLVGMGVLIVALSGGYYLFRKSTAMKGVPPDPGLSPSAGEGK